MNICIKRKGTRDLVLTAVDPNQAVRNAVSYKKDLRGAVFAGWELSDIPFSETDLSGASFEGAHLIKVLFDNCNMSGVDMSGVWFDHEPLRSSMAMMQIGPFGPCQENHTVLFFEREHTPVVCYHGEWLTVDRLMRAVGVRWPAGCGVHMAYEAAVAGVCKIDKKYRKLSRKHGYTSKVAKPVENVDPVGYTRDSDYSREDLLQLCHRAVVPCTAWDDVDSYAAQLSLDGAYRRLIAGCTYCVRVAADSIFLRFDPLTASQIDVCNQNALNIDHYTDWLKQTNTRKNHLRVDACEDRLDHYIFSIPTHAWLDKANGRDWCNFGNRYQREERKEHLQ